MKCCYNFSLYKCSNFPWINNILTIIFIIFITNDIIRFKDLPLENLSKLGAKKKRLDLENPYLWEPNRQIIYLYICSFICILLTDFEKFVFRFCKNIIDESSLLHVFWNITLFLFLISLKILLNLFSCRHVFLIVFQLFLIPWHYFLHLLFESYTSDVLTVIANRMHVFLLH